MDFRHMICRILHDEHQVTVGKLDELEDLLARGRRGLPDLDSPATRQALSDAAAIGQEVRTHFDFEENDLFTRLSDVGDGAIGEHLTEEHETIFPVCEKVSDLALGALDGRMTEPQWDDFRALAAELIERMQAHIQKEEMALLPMLDETLEPEDDLTLTEAYAGQA